MVITRMVHESLIDIASETSVERHSRTAVEVRKTIQTHQRGYVGAWAPKFSELVSGQSDRSC